MDCITCNNHFEIHSEKNDIYKIKKLLEKKISNFISTEIEWISYNKIVLDQYKTFQVKKLIENLEDNDDVQRVYTNLNNRV